MKINSYELTDRELKSIIDYIRSEARLSYNLQRILWLMKEGNRVRKETMSLAQIFRQKKWDLRRNVNKEIYKYIIDGDEIDTKFPQARLKKNDENQSSEEKDK